MSPVVFDLKQIKLGNILASQRLVRKELKCLPSQKKYMFKTILKAYVLTKIYKYILTIYLVDWKNVPNTSN